MRALKDTPRRMLNRHTRLLVTFHVVSDALLAMTAFIIAYALRFHSVVVPLLIPITKGVPPLWQYIQDLPFIAVLVPFGFQLQGLYRLRRGRSRVDDFFAVFVGSILAVLFGIVATLYVTVYFASPAARARGQFEVSQPVWAIFLVLNVALTYASRELVREVLERRWRARIGLQRMLRARLEELDGLPVININDVPLQGLNTLVKRGIDIVISAGALLVLAIPFWIIAALVKLTSKGNIFYRQERMGLDGKPFMIYKFRSMYEDAEAETGPVFASEEDPRRTPIGKLLRQSNIDELPQLWNVLKGDMSIVGPRPERPLFVAQFKNKIPQYMLRHKVKAGITGWAQVNGWRGNTSIEKRIEYDLYYIEHWSVKLDLKIMWLTLLRGFFHKHAY